MKILILLLNACLLISCAPATVNPLIGGWEEANDSGVTLSFTADNKVIFTIPTRSSEGKPITKQKQGTYRLTGNNKVFLGLPGINNKIKSMPFEFSISNDTLSLIYDDDEMSAKTTYKRIR